MNSRARFTHMQDGQAEDWAIIAQDFAAYAAELPARFGFVPSPAAARQPT